MTDDTARLLRWSGLARSATGAAYLLAPGRLGRVWTGAAGGNAAVAPITRAFAARDLAIGLGTLRALSKREPLTGWVLAGVLADTTDSLGTWRAGHHLPTATRRVITLVAGASALGHAGLLRSLKD